MCKMLHVKIWICLPLRFSVLTYLCLDIVFYIEILHVKLVYLKLVSLAHVLFFSKHKKLLKNHAGYSDCVLHDMLYSLYNIGYII